MKTLKTLGVLVLFTLIIGMCSIEASAQLRVVCTFADYAAIAREVGGDRVVTEYLSQGIQDPHFVSPKPSLALRLRDADMFVCSGMDLEIWAHTLLDKARNNDIMDGGIGYVTVSGGIDILEKPAGEISRAHGDVHVSGNPHFHTSAISWRSISRNILTGLKKIDPQHAEYYTDRQQAFVNRVDRALFGEELVEMFGGDALCRLVVNGTLFEFLDNEYQGEKLVDRLGGWMNKALPLRGQEVVAYHKNWSYFARDFGLKIIGFIEPNPGIPPTPKHVEDTVRLISEHDVDAMLVASYFEQRQPRAIAEKTGIRAVFLHLSVDAAPGLDNNFRLMDYWIDNILSSMSLASTQ